MGFIGKLHLPKYKLIEDRIILGCKKHGRLYAIGHNNKSSALSVYDEVRVGETEEEDRRYNTTNGQRMMLFYHPWFEYTTIQNDLGI